MGVGPEVEAVPVHQQPDEALRPSLQIAPVKPVAVERLQGREGCVLSDGHTFLPRRAFPSGKSDVTTGG